MNNPFAFPNHPDIGASDAVEPGMTLRDYFAAHALAGCLADPNFGSKVDTAADIAYKFADAMLAERSRVQS